MRGSGVSTGAVAYQRAGHMGGMVAVDGGAVALRHPAGELLVGCPDCVFIPFSQRHAGAVEVQSQPAPAVHLVGAGADGGDCIVRGVIDRVALVIQAHQLNDLAVGQLAAHRPAVGGGGGERP